MRGALEIPGVSNVDCEQGKNEFSVSYDPAKVKPDAMIKLLHEAGETGAKVMQ